MLKTKRRLYHIVASLFMVVLFVGILPATVEGGGQSMGESKPSLPVSSSSTPELHAPPLYGPYGVVSKDYDWFGRFDKDGNHILELKWVGKGPPPPGQERGHVLNEDGDLVPVSRPFDPVTETYHRMGVPLGQTFDKKLHGAIKNRANIRQPRSPETQSSGGLGGYNEGPGIRERARTRAHQRMIDAESTRSRATKPVEPSPESSTPNPTTVAPPNPTIKTNFPCKLRQKAILSRRKTIAEMESSGDFSLAEILSEKQTLQEFIDSTTFMLCGRLRESGPDTDRP